MPTDQPAPFRLWGKHWALGLLILFRLLIGLAYSRAIPAWESYDEPGHFGYAVQIATTGTRPGETDKVLNNERIQPPGYYMLMAAILKLSGSDVSGFHYPQVNPYFYYGNAGLNYAIHPRTLSASDQQVELALTLLRMITVLISLLGIAFTYNAARLLFPARPDLVFFATALFALWPQAIFNSSTVSNDGLAMTIGALLTWWMVRLSSHRLSVRLILLCLAVVTIGALVKVNLLAFFAPLALVMLIAAPPRLIVPITVVGTVVIGGLLTVLQRLPGVLLPIIPRGFLAIKDIWNNITAVNGTTFVLHALQYALDSGYGLFGWGNLPLPGAIQYVWEALLAIGMLGFFAALIRRRLAIRWQQWVVPFAIFASVTGGALMLAIYDQNIFLLPGRYLLPALPALCFLLMMSFSAWTARSRRTNTIVRRALIVGLVILNSAIPPLMITPPYALPPLVAESDIPNYQPTPLTSAIDWLGYDLPQNSVKVGQTLPVDIYFKALKPPIINFTIHVVIVGPDKVGHGSADTTSGNGSYPSSIWTVNQPFRDRYDVPVQSDFPAPGMGTIWVTLTPITPPFHDPIYVKFGSVMVYP